MPTRSRTARLVGLTFLAGSLGACFGGGGTGPASLGINSPADVSVSSAVSASVFWTVTNTGSTTVTLAEPVIVGNPNISDFPGNNTTCRANTQLSPGGTCVVNVTLLKNDPATPGTYDVTVTVNQQNGSASVTDTVAVTVS